MMKFVAPAFDRATISVYAGSPMFFSLVQNDHEGREVSLTGRLFVFSIYRPTGATARELVENYEAEMVMTSGRLTAVWRLDGTVSEELIGQSGLRFDIRERLDNGSPVLMTGTLTVLMSGPEIADYNDAPLARYITRLICVNDPTDDYDPKFTRDVVPYAPVAVVLNPPVNTALPTLTGTTQEGQSLTVSNGTWTNSPTSFAYAWLRGSSVITGATGASYALTSADVGSTITARVTASNADGSATATSAPSAQIVAAPVVLNPPANTSAPTISGTAQEGQTLTVSNGAWTNSPTAYAYQWFRASAAITGATASTYVLVRADVESTITARVTASNADGSATVTSAATSTVIAAEPVPPAGTQFVTTSNGDFVTTNNGEDRVTVAA